MVSFVFELLVIVSFYFNLISNKYLHANSPFYYIISGLWVKHLWETINVMYKAALKDWNKGTGSGPGINAAFQSWNEEKFDIYDVDVQIYNHTDIHSCPIVLFQNYTTNKILFLTVIPMWDKLSDYILYSNMII